MKYFIFLIFLFFSTISRADYYDYNWTYDQDLIDQYIAQKKDFILDNITPIYIRGIKYRAYISYVAKKNDVPKEFFALAAIESAYNPKIKSSAGAVGMWQIMKPTGKEMGLKITNYSDERKNWKKSTVAATRYIKHLAEDFFDGDYELAILAYNAGVGNVKKSMERMNSKNAWYLIKNDNKLKQESKDYLVKFIIYAYYFEYLDSKMDDEMKKEKNA